MKEIIIKNTIYSGASSVVIGVIDFFMLAFMISKMGAAEYGLIGMASLFFISGYISLFEMGFQSSITRFIADYHAKIRSPSL